VRKDAQNHRAGRRQSQILPAREVMLQDDDGEHHGGKAARAEPPEKEPASRFQARPGKLKAIEDLSKYSDWTMQVCNQPTTATCTVEMVQKHPELVVTWLKAMIKVGRWANEHKHAAASILDKQTYYWDVEDTYQGIKDVDMVPTLSPKNLAAVKIGKGFMLSHGYIKNDFDVHEWAAPEFFRLPRMDL
jgi:ABC-type nitrate/sulfonate/bicarbonate transport system substrate-binding protein